MQENKNIYRVKPGLWALVNHRNRLEAEGIVAENESDANSQATTSFNHTYYQALLVQIGNFHGLQTYVPPQDKNKMFLNRTPLADLCDLSKIPSFSYEAFVNRSSTIDVIWFKTHSLDPNNILMPHAFFEVEYSTDIQNSLLKYADLADFNSRMVIVADQKRQAEFEKKLSFSAFKELRERKSVEFLSCDKLVETYEHAAKLHLNSILF